MLKDTIQKSLKTFSFGLFPEEKANTLSWFGGPVDILISLLLFPDLSSFFPFSRHIRGLEFFPRTPVYCKIVDLLFVFVILLSMYFINKEV